jgi:hypothetical protein
VCPWKADCDTSTVVEASLGNENGVEKQSSATEVVFMLKAGVAYLIAPDQNQMGNIENDPGF